MKKTVNIFLKKIGKQYQIPESMPLTIIISEVLKRVVMLLRGIIFVRKRIFVGKSVQVIGKNFLNIGRYSTLDDYSKVIACSEEGVKMGERSKLGAFSVISATSHLSKFGKGVEIGNDVGISEYSFLGAAGGLKIGNNVIMGQYVSFHSEEHVYEDLDRPIQHQGVRSQGIIVEDNVWIGAKVTLLDGTKVGKNCVIAAGAVVKGEFPAGSIIGGIPAKVIKKIG